MRSRQYDVTRNPDFGLWELSSPEICIWADNAIPYK
jgi:hypothetical protein